ncbi:MAG TPA: IclR family transcriptional regulator [Acetobacteraceae bacterium]|nr:IclR family transcriptional regulator [Acetobacteraceae bacterium]
MRLVKGLLQRCTEVVELLATAGTPCRLSDIAAALDMPKSAAHRLLQELKPLGWVEQDGPEGPYRLTVRFALLGHRVLRASRLLDLVPPVLDGLAARTGELVRLTLATEEGLTWFAFAQGAPPGLMYQPGMDGPVVLHATANGKAFLATLGDDDALALARRGGFGRLRPTERTIDAEATLLAELGQVRYQGYAVADQEAERGVVAVAVAVCAADGQAHGTMSVAGPHLRIGGDRVPVLAQALKEAAASLASVWPDAAVAKADRR